MSGDNVFFEEGRKAGHLGRSEMDCPYTGEGGAQWLAGHDKAMAEVEEYADRRRDDRRDPSCGRDDIEAAHIARGRAW